MVIPSPTVYRVVWNSSYNPRFGDNDRGFIRFFVTSERLPFVFRGRLKNPQTESHVYEWHGVRTGG